MHDSASPQVDGAGAGVIAELPRRQPLDAFIGETPLSKMRLVSFKASRSRSTRRLFTWFNLLLYFAKNTLFDRLLGRDSLERRATRLRSAFERNGGSFIKLGIHLSTRIDFMPWVYSNELSTMSDRMEPFPIQAAIAIVERSTRRPLTAVFSRFDPEPTLSTSVACFYQAILHSGEKVMVKVRRPGVGEQFMADIQAFDWLLSLAEFLTVVRPGFTKGMRGEFRDLLLEELDFIQEARRQDSFCRSASESRQNFFSAPRIYLDLSGEEIVVSEFKSGMWLWELLAAVEAGNETVLAQAREMNIDPKKVARRLLWVNYWAWGENLFFHADPHPNNIIVGRDSTLYFINFASTGALNRSKRQAMRQILSYANQRDPQNMARSALILMEPLPPVDIIELTLELESYNWQLLYALEAEPESLTWQERTSAIHWLGLIRLARKYGIVIDIQVLRLIRTTLLFESVAVQLHPRINFVRQYQKFNSYRAESARRRVTDSILNQVEGKNSEQLIIRLDRIAHTVENFFTRTSHMLSLPSVNFNTMMSKWSFAVYIFFRFLAHIAGLTVLFFLVLAVNTLVIEKQPVNAYDILQSIFTNPFYQITFLLLILVSGRTVLFRMDDKEV